MKQSEESRQADILSLEPVVKSVARYVLKMVLKYHTSVELCDLIQLGWIGAIKAVESYSAKKGESLKLYSRYRIRGEIIDQLRRDDCLARTHRAEVRGTNCVPFHYSLDMDDDTHYADEHALHVFSVVEAEFDANAIINKSELTPRDKRVVYEYYQGHRQQQEIAKSLGVGPGRVSQLHLAAIKKLRKAVA